MMLRIPFFKTNLYNHTHPVDIRNFFISSPGLSGAYKMLSLSSYNLLTTKSITSSLVSNQLDTR